MSIEVTALEQQSTALVSDIHALAVTDAESYRHAGGLLVTIATYIRRVGEVLDPIVEAAHRTHKVAVSQRDALLKPAAGAKRVLGDRMAVYDQEQARIRREAELAAQRERERQERAARDAAEAEVRRIMDEAETRRLDEAAAMEARGDRAAAERLLEAPIPAPVVPPVFVFVPSPPSPTVERVEGVSYREDWSFEVVDPGLVPREFMIPNEKAIGGVVRAMRGATNIPGVRAFARRVTSVRT